MAFISGRTASTVGGGASPAFEVRAMKQLPLLAAEWASASRDVCWGRHCNAGKLFAKAVGLLIELFLMTAALREWSDQPPVVAHETAERRL